MFVSLVALPSFRQVDLPSLDKLPKMITAPVFP